MISQSPTPLHRLPQTKSLQITLPTQTSLYKTMNGTGPSDAVCVYFIFYISTSSELSNNNVCVYFTFLHLVSYLTINQQFGRKATGSHSDQRLVMSENGQPF